MQRLIQIRTWRLAPGTLPASTARPWRQGPRETVLAVIQHYLDAVLWLPPDAINDLRCRNTGVADRRD